MTIFWFGRGQRCKVDTPVPFALAAILRVLGVHVTVLGMIEQIQSIPRVWTGPSTGSSVGETHPVALGLGRD